MVSRREILLREAAGLFASRGFLGVSVQDIGSAAGITGPGIYRHFSSKEALLGAVLVSISERLLAGGREQHGAALDADQALRALVRFHVEFALTHPELITIQDREFQHVPAREQHRVRRLQREYVEIWVGCLREAVAGTAVEVARSAVHATFGLINSTPHSAGRRGVGPAHLAGLLERMALGALTAAVDGPAVAIEESPLAIPQR